MKKLKSEKIFLFILLSLLLSNLFTENAFETLKEAIPKYGYLTYHASACHLYCLKEDFVNARLHLNKAFDALKKEGENEYFDELDIKALEAFVLLGEKKYQKALKKINYSLSNGNKKLINYFIKYEILNSLNDTITTKKIIAEILSMKAETSLSRLELVFFLKKNRFYKETLKQITKFEEFDIVSYFIITECHFELKNYVKAKNTLNLFEKKMYEIESNELLSWFYYYKSLINYKMGNQSRAKFFFEKAYKLKKFDEKFYIFLHSHYFSKSTLKKLKTIKDL